MALRKGDVLASKYQITKKLGEGAFGEVYAAIDERNHKYAIKLEKSARKELLREKFVYQGIAHDEHGKRVMGVPRMYHFGKKDGRSILVLEMLGSSLKEKVRGNGGTFSLKTCLMIAVQLLNRLEHIHNCGFLHRDIKPDNILTGRPGHHERRIYIVDYGLAKKYRDGEGRHWKYETHIGFSGTSRYSSVNVMKGIRHSRRDDLESLAYSLIELRKGTLPWKSERDRKPFEDHYDFCDRVLKMKEEISIQELVDGFPGMYMYLRYVKHLEFADRPKYSFLKECFNKALEDLGERDDGNFDWVRQD